MDKSHKQKISKEKELIIDDIVSEILTRLDFLEQVGIGYLNLNRSAPTLSWRSTKNKACISSGQI